VYNKCSEGKGKETASIVLFYITTLCIAR